MGDRNVYTQPQVGPQGFAGTMKRFGTMVSNAPGAASLITTDLALNRTVGMFIVPRGFVLTSLSVTVTDLDTNGTPAIVFAIGDATDDDRFVTGATTAQAGGTNTTIAATGLRYVFADDTEINWKTTTAAATAAAGTVYVDFFGYMR
jgi:hypothetical protein